MHAFKTGPSKEPSQNLTEHKTRTWESIWPSQHVLTSTLQKKSIMSTMKEGKKNSKELSNNKKTQTHIYTTQHFLKVVPNNSP